MTCDFISHIPPFPSSFSVSPFSVSCTGCDELKGGGDSHLAFQNSTDLRYTGYTLPETNSEFTPANEFRFGIWIFSLLGVWPGPIFFRWSHGAPPILVVIVAWCRSGCKTCGMYRRRHLGDAFAKQLVELDKKYDQKSHGSFHALDSDGSNLNLTLQSFTRQGGG